MADLDLVHSTLRTTNFAPWRRCIGEPDGLPSRRLLVPRPRNLWVGWYGFCRCRPVRNNRGGHEDTVPGNWALKWIFIYMNVPASGATQQTRRIMQPA